MRTFPSSQYLNTNWFPDDLDVSPDIFEYFLGTLPLLQADPTLWCVSAWNDNGKINLIDKTAHDILYRTDFFPGLGWMLTKSLWSELSVKWPARYKSIHSCREKIQQLLLLRKWKSWSRNLEFFYFLFFYWWSKINYWVNL